MKIVQNKIACISDIHIGVHQASGMWHKISIDYAHWLKDDLLNRGTSDLFIPGDILDDRNDVPVLTLHYLTEFFKILDCFCKEKYLIVRRNFL